ncbi:LVIVD repeat-containing protein [Jannaschia sp. R86511]|uniref:LVIVD repeat-containing protein n=1 Tax=Jannaschia sp. R86511 TaxID=3093853 RepID=UPI0036D42763
MTGANRTRALRAAAIGAAAALVAGLGVAAAAGPASASSTDDMLVSGETASSSNMRLLQNLPKRGAFEPVGAFNSDLAFQGDYAFAGNYNGFTVYDIKNPRRTKEVVQVVCPGSQNDITVQGDLMFLSVDSRRTDDTCNSGAATGAQSASGDYWEGIRIFDISNPAAPVYLKSVETNCGSHTHTLVPTDDGETIYVYVSSYSPSVNVARCQPPHDAISIVEVPVDEPTAAEVVSVPVLFPEGGLIERTQGCHDITAYPEKDLAAGACMGEGVIMDISDPVNPVVLDRVADTENFAFWHSATFNNDATSVVFTDELGGGGGATCNPTVGPNKGANAIFELAEDGTMDFASYYKIPREQASTENCVAHNGSLIPTRGTDVMVQAWYQGGISLYDFTDPANPTEFAWFDRGPVSDASLVLGGSWSAYYYDGYIFSNDIQQGFDVFEVRDRRVASAKAGKYAEDFNPQTQPSF